MKRVTPSILLYALLIWSQTYIFCQNDWQGDHNAFIFTSDSITLNAEATTSSKTIFKYSDAINDAIWRLDISLQFNPSSSNYCGIYLCANKAKTDNTFNSYYVECGSSDDDIKFYKIINSVKTLLIDGINGRLNNARNTFGIQVTRSEKGEFNLYYIDQQNTSHHEGLIYDTSIMRSHYIGYHCNYTSTRSKLFQFSNLQIKGEAYIDSIAPVLDSAIVHNAHTITLYFDENVYANLQNLSIQNKEIQISSIESNHNNLTITTRTSLPTNFTLYVDSVFDTANNLFHGMINLHYSTPKITNIYITDSLHLTILTDRSIDLTLMNNIGVHLGNNKLFFSNESTSRKLQYHATQAFSQDQPLILTIEKLPFTNGDYLLEYDTVLYYHRPQLFDIIINEVFSDPSPILFYSNEYIELYNRSAYVLSLKEWSLSINTKNVIIPNISIQPHSYLSLSSANNTADQQIQLDNFPALANSEIGFTLRDNSGNTIDHFNYQNTLHNEPYKRDGGWSLERINPHIFQENINWGSCIANTGGTPGRINSLMDSILDTEPPFITRIFPISSHILFVEFSEPIPILRMSNLKPQGFSFRSINSLNHHTQYEFLSNTAFHYTKPFLFTIKTEDYHKNIMDLEIQFASTKPLESQDIIINEIMFDPMEDGCEFIELYNKTDRYINGAEVFISRKNSLGKIESLISISETDQLISPHQYIVLSKTNWLNWHLAYPRIFYSLGSSYTLPNTSGSILITDKRGSIIDEVNYNADWHSDFILNTKGISLERISANGPSNDPSNWASSARIANFSTPGNKNSQALMDFNNSDICSLSSKYITPNGDGQDDLLLIKLNRKGDFRATIKIFDNKGICLQTICSGEGANNILTKQWDGTTQEGHLCTTGIYIIDVFIQGVYENTSQRKAVTLIH